MLMPISGCACPLLWLTGSVTVGLGLGVLIGLSVRRRRLVHQWTGRRRSLRVAVLMLGLAILEWFPRTFQRISHSPLPASADWLLDALFLAYLTATAIIFWPDTMTLRRPRRHK